MLLVELLHVNKMMNKLSKKFFVLILLLVVTSSFSLAQVMNYVVCVDDGRTCDLSNNCLYSRCEVEEGKEYTLYTIFEEGYNHTWWTNVPNTARLLQPLDPDGSDRIDGTFLRSRWRFSMVEEDTYVTIKYIRGYPSIPPSSYGYLSICAMTAAQWLLVCMTVRHNSLQDFHGLLRMVKYIQKTHHVPLKIAGFLFNLCDTKE